MTSNQINLKQFGLSTQQSLVYQTGLQSGLSPVSRISRRTGVHRVTTYNVLKELVKKGFATTTKQGNTTYYQMLHPSMIHHSLTEKAAQFEQLMPSLTSLIAQQSSNFRVQVFEGFEGVCRLYTHLLDSSTPFREWLGVDHIDPEFRKRLYEIYLPKRLAKRITNRAIVSQTDLNVFFADPENVPYTQVRVIDHPLFDLSCEKVLFDTNKILIASMSTGNISGILIESQLLYDSYASMFEWMWKMSE